MGLSRFRTRFAFTGVFLVALLLLTNGRDRTRRVRSFRRRKGESYPVQTNRGQGDCGHEKISAARADHLERARERRDLVGVLEVAADRQAARQPVTPPDRRQERGQVDRGRLALEVRVGRQDNLLDRLAVPTRPTNSRMRSSSGPIPSIGEIAPCRTW